MNDVHREKGNLSFFGKSCLSETRSESRFTKLRFRDMAQNPETSYKGMPDSCDIIFYLLSQQSDFMSYPEH